ncbi:hypothetical protein FLONG3_9313 [Fusarium longipes]|uniref:Major facilitator superfamily (MFS) profile domain-containing protein n=1 Tax=Fusarium longipes TaxID=694270 RepID=A0A395RYJ1_9HYPO|nr:hypothetical protein FLONG3_9313 [Fusarium longipes]
MPLLSRYSLRQNRGFLGSDSSALPSQDAQDRQQLRYELDLNSWNFRIWGVCASGFLTDSYNLFSTNVILASVAFVYWPNGPEWSGLLINFFTLLGSVVGQVLFGYLADRYGRTRLYGVELVLVIVSTIGVATSSRGYNDLSFLGLFTWWRFVMGIGIGAEYPLSAVITSEWSSTQSRATMLSSVFMMQPIGQALAQLVGLFVLLGFQRSHDLQGMRCGLDKLHEEECKKALDGVWRIVIGSGAVPALLAIIFRFFLFDCGIYSLEVRNKPGMALVNTQRIYGAPHGAGLEAFPGGGTAGRSIRGSGNGPNLFPMGQLNQNQAPTIYQVNSPGGNNAAPSYRTHGLGEAMHLGNLSQPVMPVQFSREDLHNYFIRDGNWAYLLGTAATWFFLDVSFYGMSLDNRGTLSTMWATTTPTRIDDSLECWTSSLRGGNSTVPDWAIRGLPVWSTDATHPCNTIYDVLIEQTKQYLLTVSLASIAGSACFVIFANRIPRRQWLTASFLVLAGFFVITGCVYYGVHQKQGAPATVVFVAICHFMFNFVAAVGAIFSWAYLPDSQRRVEYEGKTYLESKTLEELGEGRVKARLGGELVTIEEKWDAIKRRKRSSMRSDPSVPDGTT